MLITPMPSAFLSGGGSLLSSTPGGAIGDPLSATKSILPSGLTRIPRGRLPTGIVPVTRCEATSMTLMSPPFSFVTKRRPAVPPEGAPAGAAAAGCAGGSGWEHAVASTAIVRQPSVRDLIAEPILLRRGTRRVRTRTLTNIKEQFAVGWGMVRFVMITIRRLILPACLLAAACQTRQPDATASSSGPGPVPPPPYTT